MSIKMRCQCGTDLRLPNEAAGKHIRCRQCGQEFFVPENVITSEVDDALRAERAEEEERQLQRAGLGGFGSSSLEEEYLPRGFWADAAISFVFVKDPQNIIVFGFLGVLHILMAALGYAFVLGFFGQVIVLGWLSTWWFNVIGETANGEDRYPNFPVQEGWAGIFFPFFQFLGTWLVVQFPSIVAAIVIEVTGQTATLWPVPVILSALGIFIWPTVMLAAALGGFTAALRIDMHVLTAFRAFFPYLAIWIMLLAALAVLATGSGMLDTWLGINLSGAGGLWAVFLVRPALEAYTMLIVMRLIGLFYRHFQDHIPWVVSEEERRELGLL